MSDPVYVYVAGPLHTSGRATVNIRKAVMVAEMLVMEGLVPFVPHLYAYWDIISPHAGPYWLDLDRAWFRKCNAMVRIQGESAGADKEEQWAMEAGIPLYSEHEMDILVEDFRKGELSKKPESSGGFTLGDLQRELREWVGYNFEPGNVDNPARAYRPLLGMNEESGELSEAVLDLHALAVHNTIMGRISHSQLKSEQGIRGKKEEHDEAIKDALIDNIVFTVDYATAKGWDVQEMLVDIWNKVSQRDWKKDSQAGNVEPVEPAEEKSNRLSDQRVYIRSTGNYATIMAFVPEQNKLQVKLEKPPYNPVVLVDPYLISFLGDEGLLPLFHVGDEVRKPLNNHITYHIVSISEEPFFRYGLKDPQTGKVNYYKEGDFVPADWDGNVMLRHWFFGRNSKIDKVIEELSET